MVKRRKSPLRTDILRLLKSEHLLSAPAILEKLDQVGRSVNKTSVYRALEILVEEEMVSRQTVDAETLYEISGHHHDHLICTNCGRVESVECSVQAPQTLKNYTIEDHSLTLYGICPNCR